MRGFGPIAVLCFSLAAGSGCRHARPGPPPEYQPPPFSVPLPATNPGPLPVTVESPKQADSRPAPTYRRLTAEQCQQLAVRNSRPAQRLDKAQFDARNSCDRHSDGRALADALGHAADEIRNRAAADALDLYAKLIAAEAGSQVYREAEADLAKLLDDNAKAAELGVKEPDDVAGLEGQLAEFRSELAKLDGSIRELNHGLRALLGADLGPNERFWPDEPVVRPEILDVDMAIRRALTYRPDILLPKSLNASQDALAPVVAKQLLGSVSPLLGAEPGSLPAGIGPVGKALAGILRLQVPTPADATQTQRQVAGLIGDREELAKAEVRAGADRILANEARALVYRDSVNALSKRVAELERAEAAGRTVTVPLANAKAAWRKAKGQLIEAATDHFSAVVKYRQAQGLLVREVMDPAFAKENGP